MTQCSCHDTVIMGFYYHQLLRRRRMTILFMAWSVPDHKTRDHLTTGMIRYGITRFHSFQNPTLLRGVICRVKGVICRKKGVICRNWETTHVQVRNSRVFRYDTGDKPWAHTTHIVKLSDPVIRFWFFWHWDHGSHFTCLWLHGFSCLKQLCPLSYHSSNLLIPHRHVMQALQSLIWC